MSSRDIFVVHTRSDPDQLILYNSLSAWGKNVGIGVIDYEDWSWESDNAWPDTFGRMPEDPWAYMPFINTDAINGWFKHCEVVLVVESGPDHPHTHGVTVELDELGRVGTNPLPAIVVVTSFGDSKSVLLRDRVGKLAREFFWVAEPEDVRLKCLVAIPWLVSRLQRSGHTGMEILTEAQRQCPYLNRFIFFGPHWTVAMVNANATRPPVNEWWLDVADLHAFMISEATGIYRDAWRSMAELIAGRLTK